MADSNPRQIRGKIKQIVGNPDVVPKKTKGGKHKYYKKPGKGHNHDTCDACGDAGDILCCDSCPASFHLTCFDPPLQEKDLPKGGWKCRACTLKKCRYVKTMMPNLEKTFELFENPDVGCKGLHNLFRLMGEHWRKQNPKMYTLPTNVANYPPQFPGYSKASTLKGKSATPKPKANAPTKEKENKVIVKRTTVCFSCDKSHAKGVILKCDYCPALYHLDCLDPPLTSPPSGFWMCPLHAQPFLEAKYLTSSALSERVRVWDMAEANKNRGMRTLVSFASSIHGRYSNIKAEVILPTKPKVQIPVVINEIYKRYRESKITEKSKTEIINKIDSVSVTNPLPNGESCKRKIDMEEGDKTKSEAPNLPSLLRPGAVFKSGFDLLLAASELTNEETVDKCLQGISPLMVKLLAFQALSNNPRLAPTYNHTLDPSQDLDIILSHGHPIHVQSGGPMVQIKRMRLEPTFKLVYLNGGKLLDFHRRMLEIGVGGSAGLDLQTLGYCVNVSRGHAKIFYDSIKCQWELLNYSPQGSWINGILYGCDTTVYAAGLPQDETLRTFKDIVDHKRQKLLEQRNPKESISGILAKNGNCACLKELPQKPASCWEGSAIIQKGDQLQFGCHKFVVVETGVIPKFNSSPSTATPSASGPSSSGPAICFPAASAASASAVSASVPSTSRSGTSFPADPAPGTSAASASTPITSSPGAPAPGTSGSGTCFPAASAASALALSTSASVPSGSTPSTSFNENEQNIIPAMDIDGGCGSSDVP